MPQSLEKMRAHTIIKENCLINGERAPHFKSGYFDPANPALQAKKVGSGGRQSAWFIELPSGVQGVLRHYRRGGLIAKLVNDRYFWTGARRTRSWSEYEVLLYLSKKLNCVPAPVAARFQRTVLCYKAAIIVERIADTQPLADLLTTASPSAVAAAILAVHNAGVWHADLNAYNVLLNQNGQVWIIDFDRARRITLSSKQRQNNLYRLRRSLIKVHGERGLAWWLELNRAYLQQCDATKPK